MPSIISVLLLALCLAAVPVQAKEKKSRPAVPASQCPDLKKLIASAYPLLPRNDETGRLLMAAPPQGEGREDAATTGPLKVRMEEDLVSLVIFTPTAFSPWLGAGLDAPTETVPASAYRVGAGLGCDLGRLTRLNLGYRFSSAVDLQASDRADVEDEDRHQFTVGLHKSF